MAYTVAELYSLLKKLDRMEADGKVIYAYPIPYLKRLIAGYITALEKRTETEDVPRE